MKNKDSSSTAKRQKPLTNILQGLLKLLSLTGLSKTNLYWLVVLVLIIGWLPTNSIWQVRDKHSINIINNDKWQELKEYNHPPQTKIINKSFPWLSAQSYIVIDNKTNKILVEKNSQTKIYPASITKLATALTALNIYPLEEMVEIKEEYKEGKIMELVVGERMTVRSLVQALLVFSANDAAFNLAIHQNKGVSGFVEQMNLIAKNYNLKNTHFTNFDGIHDENHYSTVYDLAQIARLASKNQILRDYVKLKQISISDIEGTKIHDLVSTNELLGKIPEVEGMKTGWTPEAGGCFVALININGNELISVVAQSEDRFNDTEKIISWAKASVDWVNY